MRSNLPILVLLAMLVMAATAHADPEAPPPGAPAALKAFLCTADGANRSCVECTPDSTGGQFCERCTRTADGTPLRCSFADGNDRDALNAMGITATRNINRTWRPKPAYQTFACTADRSCIECEPDGAGGTFCDRCKRNANDGLEGPCTLGADDRAELAKHGITPSATRLWSTWIPWEAPKVAVLPPSLATGQLPGITEYGCSMLETYNERVCQECQRDASGGTACTRVLRDATLQPKNSWPLVPAEVESLESRGVKVANAQPAATVQAPVTAPVPPPATARAAEDTPWRHRKRGVSFGIEFGHVSPADGNNIYGPGYGRGYVFGYSIFELRLEHYDLPDRSHTYDNVFDATASFLAYSLAARPTLLTKGPVELTVLAGLALVVRQSMRMDPNDLVTESEIRSQFGGALLAGVGARVFDVLTVDVRAYLTSWQDISGMRAELGTNDALTYVPLTESPGGTPITVNVGAGWAF